MSSWFKYTVEDNNQRLTTISDLITMKIYSVSVSASTAEGEGPASFPVQVKTQQGGMYCRKQLNIKHKAAILYTLGSYTNIKLPCVKFYSIDLLHW